jgi:hypothetical protein
MTAGRRRARGEQIGGAPMAKHCTNCGHELRETDKFCAECGTAVGGNPAQWEYCEVTWVNLNFTNKCFMGTAIGPKGIYSAGQSQEFDDGRNDIPWASDMKAATAINAFVIQLQSDGWEVLPNKGPYWFSYKFRRPVSN